VEHDGTHERAFVFRFGTIARRLAYAASSILACLGAILAAAAPTLAGDDRNPVSGVLIGLSMAAFFGGAAFLLRRDRFGRDAGIALTPTGIVTRGGFGASLVRWDAIAEVTLVQTARSSHLGVKLARPDDVVAGPNARRIAGWQRRLTGYDLGYPLDGLIVRPERFAQLVRWCLEHPEARRELGTMDGFSRVPAEQAPHP
jgi:hypothetical protein